MTGGATILFVEVPDLYAAVELRDAPHLAGAPILVGGDPAKRGKLQSASAAARARGVQLGESMQEALARCPGGVALRTDMSRYREAGGALRVCMRRVAESLEPAGLGAAYIDARSTAFAPRELAERLIARVREDLNLPLRAGVAPTKLLARLAAESVAAGALRCVGEAEVAAFLDPMPLERLPKVGRKAVERLAALGARSVGQLRALDAAAVEAVLGNHGRSILAQACGGDENRVRGARHPSTISRSETLSGPAGPLSADVSDVLRRLARDLELTLARQGLRAHRIALRLDFDEGAPVTRSETHGEPLGRTLTLLGAAEQLLLRVGPDEERPVRTVALRVAGLQDSERASGQLELF